MYNPYLVIPFAIWAITQLTKFAVAAFRGRLDFRYLYSSGGMPSVHAAVVSSLAVTALLVDGASSHLFGLTVIVAAIVMYDSFGVRRSSGEQGAALNMIIGSLNTDRVRLNQPDLHVREILGHQPKEVLVGAIMGTVLAMLFNYNHLHGLSTFLSVVPGHVETTAYLTVLGVMFLVGIVFQLVIRSRRRRSPAWRHLLRWVSGLTGSILVLGGLTALVVFERASFLAWRWLPIFVIVLEVIAAMILAGWGVKHLPPQLATEATQERKEQWLKPTKKKHKKKR